MQDTADAYKGMQDTGDVYKGMQDIGDVYKGTQDIGDEYKGMQDIGDVCKGMQEKRMFMSGKTSADFLCNSFPEAKWNLKSEVNSRLPRQQGALKSFSREFDKFLLPSKMNDYKQ